MHQDDTIISGRSMRWYEWLLALLLLALACGARADSVYKCTGSDGAIAYQGMPCALAQQTSIEIAPAPSYTASPTYAVPAQGMTRSSRTTRDARRNLREDRGETSYECRVANGDVFYRHSSCPKSMSGAAAGAKASARSSSASTQKLTVSAREVSRAEACAQIHRPGAIGRRGREHDDDVSTYDRNLGRDPCK